MRAGSLPPNRPPDLHIRTHSGPGVGGFEPGSNGAASRDPSAKGGFEAFSKPSKVKGRRGAGGGRGGSTEGRKASKASKGEDEGCEGFEG